MKILSLRFAAVLQSWGSASRFTTRSTEHFPTKSGVIGLIGSALGITREDPNLLAKLESIDIAVREDRRGSLMTDYHTVEFIPGSRKISHRVYIQNAVFLVGVFSKMGDNDLLSEIEHALSSPHNTLFFGRKACVPEGRVVCGIDDFDSLDSFLSDRPLMLHDLHQIPYRERTERLMTLPYVVSDPSGDEFVNDNPISFSAAYRSYSPRFIKRGFVTVPNPFFIEPQGHDVFEIIEAL